jgi:hypothetical protein
MVFQDLTPMRSGRLMGGAFNAATMMKLPAASAMPISAMASQRREVGMRFMVG